MAGLVHDFLARKRIAVTGVSRTAATHGANAVYRHLRERGYQVFVVNPNGEQVEGDRCYADLRSIPDGVDGVVIATAPGRPEAIARQCAELGIRRVWMHHGRAQTGASPAAVACCRHNDIAVTASVCPLMFAPTSDTVHRCMRWVLERTAVVPTGI